MYVYFILVGRYFKIGATHDAQRRLISLHRSGTRYTFPADASIRLEDRELYKVIEGWKDVEHAIHIALDHFAVGLEWFLDEPPLREFIDALPTEPSDRFIRDLRPVLREGGWCGDEYRRVQRERADREVARYMAKRAAS